MQNHSMLSLAVDYILKCVTTCASRAPALHRAQTPMQAERSTFDSVATTTKMEWSVNVASADQWF